MSLDQLNPRVYLRVNCLVVWKCELSRSLSVFSASASLFSLVSVEATRGLLNFHLEGGSQTSVVFNGTHWDDWLDSSNTQTLHMLGDRNSGGGWEEFVWLRFTHSHVLRWLPFLRKFDSGRSCNNQTLGWMCVSLCVFQFSLLKSWIFSGITWFNIWPVQTVMKIWTSSAELPLEFKHTAHPSYHEFINILPRIRFVLVSAK